MSADRHRVLVLGGTGMLGHTVVDRFAASGYDVHASARDMALARRLNPAAAIHSFDAVHEQLDTLLSLVEPRLVVNCIGLVKQRRTASVHQDAIRLNALFPHDAAAACGQAGVRLIHISTDCVFSGELPMGQAYTERDTADARDLYGLTKHLGEVDAPHVLTLRTSIIGPELAQPAGLLEWFLTQNGGRVDGFTNALFSGLTTRALSDVLVWLDREHSDLVGLYHLSSEPISKYDLLLRLREVFNLEIEISPVAAPVINRALDSSLLRSVTDLDVPSWEQMLNDYTVERNDQHVAG